MKKIKLKKLSLSLISALLISQAQNAIADSNAEVVKALSDIVNTLVAKGVLTEDDADLLDKVRTIELESQKKAPLKKGNASTNVSYGKRGFELNTDDGKFGLAIQNRIQFRYAEPFDADPKSLEEINKDSSSFMIRRARTKLSGHAFQPWIKYYMQYDWSQPVLRDLSLTIDKYSWAQVRFGRGKVTYNNERVTSSANQQFINRSIVNDIFTVDRQQGIEVKGNLFAGTWHDVTYWAGAFTGEGISERTNDDNKLMYSGRLQWNAMGGEIKFSQSDTEFHDHAALNIAIAANTNRSRCTAFETDSNSCRTITDLNSIGQNRYASLSPSNGQIKVSSGQYEINQMMEEINYMYKGFSLLHELHHKKIRDVITNDEVKLLGGFVQAGYFPHGIFNIVPRELEIAGRYAYVDMDTDRSHDKRTELSTVINYFVDGHANKASIQLSRLTFEDPFRFQKAAENRLWAQWDLSF
jgi:phosphate-selective porin OprO/OprP